MKLKRMNSNLALLAMKESDLKLIEDRKPGRPRKSASSKGEKAGTKKKRAK
jgi:hypothetical protein